MIEKALQKDKNIIEKRPNRLKIEKLMGRRKK